MTDSFVTQCPHCQTSFRVSHAQLSVARGMVRCGSCLQVFNAAKQLLEQSAAAKGAEPITTPAPAPAAPAVEVIAPQSVVVAQPAPLPVKREDPAVDLDSLDLDDLDVELARLEQREIQRPESFGRASQTPEHDEVESFSARRDEPQVAPENWEHGLSHDDVSQLPELHAEVFEEHHEHPEPDLLIEPLTLDEIEPDRHRTEPSFSMAPRDLDDEPHARERMHANGAPDEQGEPLRPGNRRGRSEPALRDSALLDLTDDPLQLAWQKPKPRWGRRALWAVLALLALAGLGGQYIAYHFDELARQDQYRSWFQDICPHVGCKVPSKVDIKLLRSSNLVVRSHPDFQGALVVDAIIYNRASFSQPFPLLELRFADTTGQLIASRRFKPGEYLSGELAGKDEMPPQTPIHIALDILDPGPKAVNYSLNFRSPE
ncbi:DUF3426 domain-containing protein [Pseudomonas sp. LP_7_YM]|uniref:DUF3426 domain-containing protein n=1 Tax=Pseudomonas sp. LP_7_YM TaxID=2485137 RepID=UPI00106194C5|nr:DUF3426 domain-containing protein [Pseudomonas sp. LP_7_YM]TDV65867.1 putative Zn finger-like uncharacterized protein [Pseudomonas sp. LP_7_YM]